MYQKNKQKFINYLTKNPIGRRIARFTLIALVFAIGVFAIAPAKQAALSIYFEMGGSANTTYGSVADTSSHRFTSIIADVKYYDQSGESQTLKCFVLGINARNVLKASMRSHQANIPISYIPGNASLATCKTHVSNIIWVSILGFIGMYIGFVGTFMLLFRPRSKLSRMFFRNIAAETRQKLNVK